MRVRRQAWVFGVVLVGVLWRAGICGAQSAEQAVVETSAGTFVIDLLTEVAPNHVTHFTETARQGGYDGTVFHRMVRYGMIQGGDPISKDPAKRELYGTGGLNVVAAEARSPEMPAGAVAAVLIPGQPDSAGAQFFIVVVDQPALSGQYTVFGHVAEGLEVVQKISEAPVDGDGLALERIEILRVSLRDRPPPAAPLFSTELIEELGTYRAVLDTSLGPITLAFFPDKAPGHVRQFLRLAQSGVYDGMSFHRVAPGFVIQTGALNTRTTPLTAMQQELVVDLQPEFNDTSHVKGIVSMARGDDPASATTSFFICTGTSSALDGVYTAFGRVVDGLSVVEQIEATPRTGETPNSRIELLTIRVVPMGQ